MFRTAIRPLPFSTQKKPSSCKLRFSIRLFTTTSPTMAPLKSWLAIPSESDFSLSNLPFGVITSRNSRDQKRPAVAIGDHVLDLLAFSQGKGFSGLSSFEKHVDVFAQPSLNAFAALGRPVHQEVRAYLQQVFSEDGKHASILKDNEELKNNALLKKEDTKTHLPMQIGDYTDFFAGINHAFNVGYVTTFTLTFRQVRKRLTSDPAPCSVAQPTLSNQITPIFQLGIMAVLPPL